MSGLPQRNIAVFDQNPNSVNLELGHAKDIIREHRSGIILIYKNGKLANELTVQGNKISVNSSGQRMRIETVYQSDEIILYKYQTE